MLTCDQCGGPAVHTAKLRDLVTTGHQARRFCADCYVADVRDRVFRQMDEHRMLVPGDRVLLCVSGEKDSTVMMDLVHRYASERAIDAELIVLAVDEGISDYRTRCANLVAEHGRQRGLRVEVRSFAQRHQTTLDIIDQKRRPLSYRMCMYCCSLRGDIVREAARELAVNKVATGLTLNDAIEHAMMCLLRGRFDDQSLPVHVPTGSDITFLAPVNVVTGYECALYGLLAKVAYLNEDCTYCGEHLRDDVAASINLLEDRNPGILRQLYGGYRRLALAATSATTLGAPSQPADAGGSDGAGSANGSRHVRSNR